MVTGGTGLVGKALISMLEKKGYQVRNFSRSPKNDWDYHWDPINGEIDAKALEGVHYIIHLAGAGIADSKWTEKRKKLIINSRIKGPELMLKHQELFKNTLKAYISSSGISYYGVETTDNIYVEDDSGGGDFPSHCVELWEAVADRFTDFTRVVKLRTGIVLDRQSGALSKLEKPIRFGFGAPLGNGKQWIPWVHNTDVARSFIHSVEQDISGAFNLVADEHISNRMLTKKVAKALSKPLWLPPVPGFVLRLVFGKMASLVLQGSRADNTKLKSTGFQFQYTTLNQALEELYD